MNVPLDHPAINDINKQSYYVNLPDDLAIQRLRPRQDGEFLVTKDMTPNSPLFFLFIKLGRNTVKKLTIGPGPNQYVMNYTGEESTRRDLWEIFSHVIDLLNYCQENAFNVNGPNEPERLAQLRQETILENQSFFVRTAVQSIIDLPQLSKGKFIIVRPYPPTALHEYSLYVGTDEPAPRQVMINRMPNNETWWLGSAEETAKFAIGQTPMSFLYIMDLLHYYHRNKFTIDIRGIMKGTTLRLVSALYEGSGSTCSQ